MPRYLPGAEPFFYEGNDVGCLLVHGFTGTPYEMQGLGKYLSKHFPYTVSGPALAGHATHVSEMIKTDWRDWYNSVDEAYLKLKLRCTRIFCIGLSLGGLLTLHLAAHRGLTGLVAVSTPAYINHPHLRYLRLFPFLPRFMPLIARNPGEDDTQDPTVNVNRPGYQHTPTGQAGSLVHELLPHVRGHLPEIKTPALLLQGRQDRTVPGDSMPIIFAELGSTDKQMMWLEPSGHLALEDYAKEQAFQCIANFISTHLNTESTLHR